MKNTAGDFWRMVWEMKSMIIIMLTNTEENEEVNFKCLLLSFLLHLPIIPFSLCLSPLSHYYIIIIIIIIIINIIIIIIIITLFTGAVSSVLAF